MDKKKCINCVEYKRCKDSTTSWIFFIIGLIATIAIRLVTLLIHINPIYGKISWYIGVSGFSLFFIYKFKIIQARTKQIKQQNILNKINQKTPLTKNDYKLISVLLCSLNSKQERINYFFIFVVSALALIIAIYIDFFK